MNTTENPSRPFGPKSGASLSSIFVAAVLAAELGLSLGLLALAISSPSNSAGQVPDGALSWTSAWAANEARDKAFFALVMCLSTAFAFASVSMKRAAVRMQFAVPAAIATPVLLLLCANLAMNSSRSIAAIALILSVASGTSLAIVGTTSKGGSNRQSGRWGVAARSCCQFYSTYKSKSFWGMLLILALFLPISFEANARSIMDDLHPKAFIGPAIQARYSAGIPGVDFFSQYSVAIPRILGLTVSPDSDTVYQWYFILASLSLLIFLVSFYLLMLWLTRSAIASLTAAVPLALLQFHWAYPLADASSFPFRYPLSAVVVAGLGWALWRVDTRRSPWLQFACVGVLTGLSIFWFTETGLILLAAEVGAVLLLGKASAANRISTWALVVITPLLTFVVLSVAIYGHEALAIEFIQGTLSPIVLYSGGLGAVAISFWPIHDPGLTFVATLVTPILVAVTVAIIGRAWSSKALGLDAPRRGVTVMIALLATGFSFKWLNMSLTAVWLAGAYWALGLIAFWIALAVRRSTSDRFRISLVLGTTAVWWLMPFIFFDSLNPTLYAWGSYRYYPSLANLLIPGGLTAPPSDVQPSTVTPSDLELIQRLAPGKGPLAVWGPFDNFYTLRSARPSHFRFSPSLLTFTSSQVPKPCLPTVVFVQRESRWSGLTDNLESLSRLCTEFDTQFVKVGESDSLVAYTRKAIPKPTLSSASGP